MILQEREQAEFFAENLESPDDLVAAYPSDPNDILVEAPLEQNMDYLDLLLTDIKNAIKVSDINIPEEKIDDWSTL